MWLADDPLSTSIYLCAAFILGTWLLSVLTNEYSWVDRIWSITPIAYVGVFANAAAFENTRLNIMFVLVALWGIRLTLNFVRRGGYKKGGEDYRWEIIRKRLAPWQFQIFNATFISPYQNALLLLISLPAYVAWLHRDVPIYWLDMTAGALMFALLIFETVGDQQQWRFQSEKWSKKNRGEEVEKNFCTTGLFRFSRHPNYFGELGQWWVFYVFAIAASGAILNVTIVGVVLLQLLFEGSIRLTEKITLSKYPEYAEYQRSTSRVMPLPRRQQVDA